MNHKPYIYKNNPIKAFGIKKDGTKVLINSNCADSALRAGQTIELYKQDIIVREAKFYQEIIFK